MLDFRGGSVCELGCGAGANLWIAEQIAPQPYIGIDNLAEQLESARTRARSLGLGNVALHQCNAASTDLPAGSVDAVFCRLLLIHQPDPMPVIDEMLRLVKPGGRVVIHEPYGPGHHCSPGKPNLVKCFKARDELAYGAGAGSPAVAHNLYRLLSSAGAVDVRVRPHVITAFGTDRIRMRTFLDHWLQILAPITEQLIESKLVTANELSAARAEARVVTPELFICHTMWCAQARKPS